MIKQPDLFGLNSRRCIMISLHPKYFDLLCSGNKKYEYRKSSFIKESMDAFVYCTSPVMQVKAFIELGTPIIGKPEEIALIKEREVSGSYDMMMDWMKGCKMASATPIEKVTVIEPISLSEIREKIPEFYPPQNFVYVDNKKNLQEILQRNIIK